MWWFFHETRSWHFCELFSSQMLYLSYNVLFSQIKTTTTEWHLVLLWLTLEDMIKWCAIQKQGPVAISQKCRPRSACTHAQSYHGFCCPLTKRVDTIEYINKPITLHGWTDIWAFTVHIWHGAISHMGYPIWSESELLAKLYPFTKNV